MSSKRLARVLVGALLLPLGVASAVPATSADATVARRVPNPTVTNAGSMVNGLGNLKVSLSTLSDGRVRVNWVIPKTRSKILKFVVTSAANRRLDVMPRAVKVGPKTHTLLIPPAFPAFSAYSSSGNFTFVKVSIFRQAKGRSDSPIKWIQAPITASCTASATNQVKVATFNVHTWTGDSTTGTFGWNNRGPNVISQILAGGARVVAIQEASGRADAGFGSVRQIDWIIRHLNAADTTPGHDWQDAISNDALYLRPGLVGTRIVYDASKYRVLHSDVLNTSASATGTINPARIPWAQMQDVTSPTTPAFVFASVHLQTGETASAYSIRTKQMNAIIPFLEDTQATYGGQLIAAGDFNSTVDTKPNNGAQYAMLRAGFYDSFASRSITNANMPSTNSYKFPVVPSPHRRDYIMSLGPVKGSCSHVNLSYTTVANVASDHFMQVATLPLSTS